MFLLLATLILSRGRSRDLRGSYASTILVLVLSAAVFIPLETGAAVEGTHAAADLEEVVTTGADLALGLYSHWTLPDLMAVEPALLHRPTD